VLYSTMYDQLPTKEDKLDAMKAIYSKYSSAARKILMQQYPELHERVAENQ